MMARDSRRGRGQWRGCHSFKDTVSDDLTATGSTRNGGLKMGNTYYYYYELNGSTETHDPAVPSTTACPYLPGQTVNTLSVPVEHSLRKRSASLNSMRQESFRTRDPEAKFLTPRPAPSAPLHSMAKRLGSASSVLHHRSTSRSLSPVPSWKRFFSRKVAHPEAEHDLQRGRDDQSVTSFSTYNDDARSRSLTPSEGKRSRDISPEALRRYLSEGTPLRPESGVGERPAVTIPEDIVEEVDDDDNFATSAVSENQLYTTHLSPPPFKRFASSDTVPLTVTNASCLTLTPAHPSNHSQDEARGNPEPLDHSTPVAKLPKLETRNQPRWSLSTTSSVITPTSPVSSGGELPSFYDVNDDDDVLSNTESDNFSYRPLPVFPSRMQAYEGYSLPQQPEESKKMPDSQNTFATPQSPSLLTRGDADISVTGSNFLGASIDTGLDDFVNELGWMVDIIGTKPNC